MCQTFDRDKFDYVILGLHPNRVKQINSALNCDKNVKGNLRDGSADNINRVANNENAARQQNVNHGFQKPILKTVQSHNNLNNKFNNNERINNENNLNINLRNINQSNLNIINKTKNDKEIIGKEEDIVLDQATEVFNSFLQDNMMDNWDISTPVLKADSLTNLSNLN